MVNWDRLLSYGTLGLVQNFAEKKISGEDFYNQFKSTRAAGDARSLIRSGVTRSRQLARKALRYRGVDVETPSGR